MHNVYIVCAVIFSPAVIISPSYISSHCSDCDDPNDDLPVYMLHVILSERYHIGDEDSESWLRYSDR